MKLYWKIWLENCGKELITDIQFFMWVNLIENNAIDHFPILSENSDKLFGLLWQVYLRLKHDCFKILFTKSEKLA